MRLVATEYVMRPTARICHGGGVKGLGKYGCNVVRFE